MNGSTKQSAENQGDRGLVRPSIENISFFFFRHSETLKERQKYCLLE